jgi:hypothetical protein
LSEVWGWLWEAMGMEDSGSWTQWNSVSIATGAWSNVYFILMLH